MRVLLPFIILFSINASAQNAFPKNIYDFSITTLEGDTLPFSSFRGKKILIVNTASKCGFTPQYKELEALYRQYQDKLVVIGFPANNFANQEPGTNEEIATFCERNYGVTFPMSEKISVKGNDQASIYKWLTQKEHNKYADSEVKWNFQKYLIDEKGNLIGVFESKVNPLSEEITSKL